MRDLSIRARLWSVIAGFVVVILVGSAVGLYGTQQGTAAAGAIYEQRALPIAQLGRIEAQLMDTRLAVDAALTQLNAMAALEAQIGKLDKDLKAYQAQPKPAKLKSADEALSQAYASFQKSGLEPLLVALKADDGEKARAHAEGPLAEQFKGLRGRIAETSQQLVDDVRGAHEEAQWRWRTMIWVVIIGVSFAFAAVGLYGRWLVVSITRPLNEAVKVAERVAAGDLTADVDAQGRNELAKLMQALQTMNQNLSSIVARVRGVADSIATGSSEIASGNTDLSQRTEAQASNLQRTASAMEELSATVRQNAETSREANTLSGTASSAASAGGEVVARVVDTMQGISESSRRIADIVGLIDSIAFQTNILALNAAVEAARAGEAGRGFAVVAGEVRALAQRSATAAREIKTLIEQSVEKVESGSRQAHEAGQSMQQIVERVQKVSSLIGEVSHASAEQNAGIASVSQSVVELDHVTQANAALVEQSAAAAESLRQRSGELVELVSSFKLR